MLMILQIALGIVLAVAILANYQRIIVVGRKAAIGLGALMAVAAVGFGLYMAYEVVKDRQRLSAEAATPNSASKIARVKMPDGRVARFEVPEGTTPEQVQSMIEAQLPDGTILEFPAGTSSEVIQRAVKQQLGVKAESTPSQGGSAMTEAEEFELMEMEMDLHANAAPKPSAPSAKLSADEKAMFEERYAREQASKETGKKPWERDWSQAAKEVKSTGQKPWEKRAHAQAANEAKPAIDLSDVVWDDEPKAQATPAD